MKATKKYENKKILVLGLAKSGVAAAALLHKLGAFVTVNDAKEFDQNPDAQHLLELGITVITGSHPVDLLDEGFVLIVKNPGIPYSNPILEKAIKKHIPIITEIELAYQISEAPFIGITGTNGKTTTTTMIHQLLNSERQKGQAYLAGNIGFPASTVAQDVTADDVLVTELSSFQLMGVDEFRPHIAAITNLYEAHLDYHGDKAAYLAAKWRIQENMTSADYLLLNVDQPVFQELSHHTQATVIPFSTAKKLDRGACLSQGVLYYNQEEIIQASELGVPGIHNVENALVAIAVAKLSGVSTAAIKATLTQFSGVPHRTEYVGDVAGRKFYNDSKATNSLATEKALSGFENSRLVLIAGGLDRGNEFAELIPHFKGLKAAVFYGETKEKLKKAADSAGVETVHLVDTLEEAVPSAFSESDEGDAILLSPANASWDQFPNFEVRGETFVALMKKLSK